MPDALMIHAVAVGEPTTPTKLLPDRAFDA
jgi:hypothetical protein